ncbi:MAG: endonuclease MutS2 [Lachnospiraceae bacterium]|nr:endonuclease MutS2 [Lachnospiraceae bacterium]
MNEKVLHTLEYDKIIALLEAKASSEKGKALCRNLRPYTVLSDIERAQTETADALKRIFSNGSLYFAGIKDPGPALKTALAGGTLQPKDLINIASLLENVGRVRSYGLKDREEADSDSLDDRFSCLEPETSLMKEIHRCIISEEEIADDASPELRHIRKSMGFAQEKVHSTLQGLVNGTLKSYLMDNVITMRNNRYCLPVRSEYKGLVPGMIHDQSASGSTLFIEPQSVVRLNNDIREWELKERDEVQRILKVLSSSCAERSDSILADDNILSELDFIFAKAELALSMDAMRPIFNSSEIIRLKGARHPLIDPKKVVPVDLELGESFNLLIVTGPNTGGKTVSLKTMGLLELMGLSGLHIPALDRSELSFFKEIYADIGDEQSIEQSLSTFSSHMTNIVSILKKADINSLCLFDELGAGTDPTEGAALATAVVSWLHKRNIRTMATTHYSELKEYALTTNWVENACCEFDVESLMPTYRILLGVPGKSNAFAISRRLGLPEYIIDDAKQRIGEEDQKFESLLANLEKNRLDLERKRQEISAKQIEIETLQQDLDSGRQKLQASKEKILSSAKEEARQILSEAKETADKALKNLQQYADSDTLREAEKERSRIRESLKKTRATGGLPNPSESPIPEKDRGKGNLSRKNARVGMNVKILSLNLKGIIQTLPDKNGNLYVRCGLIKYQVNLSDLINLESGNGKRTSGNGNSIPKGLSKASSIHTELKLIGMNGDEAREELAAYLDEAYLSHLNVVRIVHGKGSGILRKVVHDYLKNCKYVHDYRLGEYGEGDSGVTIAHLGEARW